MGTEPSLVADSALATFICCGALSVSCSCSMHVASVQTVTLPLMCKRSAADEAGFSHRRAYVAHMQTFSLPALIDSGCLALRMMCACVGSSSPLHIHYCISERPRRGQSETGSLKIEKCQQRIPRELLLGSEFLTQAGNSAACSCLKLHEKCTHARILRTSCTVA